MTILCCASNCRAPPRGPLARHPKWPAEPEGGTARMKQIRPPRVSMSLKFRRNCAAGRKAVLHSQGGLVSWLRSPEVAAKRGMASFLKRLRCATGMPASGRRENCFHSFCVCRRELCEVFDKLKKVREIVDFTNLFIYDLFFHHVQPLRRFCSIHRSAARGSRRQRLYPFSGAPWQKPGLKSALYRSRARGRELAATHAAGPARPGGSAVLL